MQNDEYKLKAGDKVVFVNENNDRPNYGKYNRPDVGRLLPNGTIGIVRAVVPYGSSGKNSVGVRIDGINGWTFSMHEWDLYIPDNIGTFFD